MFTDKKEENQKETKPEAVFDPKNIPVHTMRDDVDMLEGKIPANNPISFSAPQAESGSAGKNGNVNIPNRPSEANSPFLKSASVPSVPAPQPNKPSSIPDFKPKEAPVGVPEAGIHPASSHNWARIGGIFVLFVAFIGVLGGGYYFYMTRYNVPAVEIGTPAEVVENTENIPEAAIPEETVVPEKFSSDKPNYLMLDVEKSELADIQKMISQKAIEIKEDGKMVPVEFVVVDQNNNPIAFKIFAVLMKINLSQKLLDDLADEFSLFIYDDQGSTRLGLALNPKNSATILQDIKAEEKTLAKTMEPLFLGEKANASARIFGNSQEGSIAIRYINLNAQNSLSVDYWFQDGKLFVATSKATGRAIISKMGDFAQKDQMFEVLGQ